MAQGEERRESWANKWEYFLSVAGYAIGIGNIWRFPYLCYRNGGGAFLVPYLLMLAIVGLPLFFLESAVGQFSTSGCLTLYNVCPIFKGIGYASILVTLIATTYYSVIVAYPLVYLIYSFNSEVPWASCDNAWNTERCYEPGQMVSGYNFTDTTTGFRLASSSNEFFENQVLRISSGIEDMNYLVPSLTGATLFAWLVIFLCIFKGVKVVGKVVWFTTPFPFVMLFILFVRGVTLPGASTGIIYYIYPDFSKLMNFHTWADAAVQIFFSLGPGFGSVVAMGSLNKFRNNCLRDALLVPVLNCATSIFAGFVVFSVLGFMAEKSEVHVAEVANSGPALAFITYPEALAMMPWAPFWSVLFFLMLFFLGIDSIFIQIEAMMVSLVDEFPKLRKWKSWVALASCILMLSGALFCCTDAGMYVLLLLDWYSVTFTTLTVCIFEVIVFCYIYGAGRVVQDITMMTQQGVSVLWWMLWIAVTPLALLMILLTTVVFSSYDVMYREYIYPDWAKRVGILTAAASVLAIPCYALYYILAIQGNSFQKHLARVFLPNAAWGPALEEHRREWEEHRKYCPVPHQLVHPDFTRKVHPVTVPQAVTTPEAELLKEDHEV